MKRSAPAALRNREPIADVLAGWLPEHGTVLEVASGNGEHAVYFAKRFPGLAWQPSDPDLSARDSIRGWIAEAGLPNIRQPLAYDATGDVPPVEANAILCINMAHISPWSATLGVLEAAEAILATGAPLIFYGPWLEEEVETAPSNLEFDASLRARNPDWGLREVGMLRAAAAERGLGLTCRRAMPANNIMLLFRRDGSAR